MPRAPKESRRLPGTASGISAYAGSRAGIRWSSATPERKVGSRRRSSRIWTAPIGRHHSVRMFAVQVFVADPGGTPYEISVAVTARRFGQQRARQREELLQATE